MTLKNLYIHSILTIFFMSMTFLTMTLNAQSFDPPSTAKKPVAHDVHGLMLTDNYEWLENKDDEEVKAWTKAQHQATEDYVNNTFAEIEGLREEYAALIDRDYTSPLSLRADRVFYTEKKKGDAQSRLYTKLDGKDILVFDPVVLDPSGTTAMSGTSYTRDASKAAIGVQTKGAEINTYYITDTKTGKQIGEPIEGLRGFSWAKDEDYAYIWVRTQEMIDEQKPIEVYLHKLGTPRSEDVFMLAPKDSKNTGGVSDSRYSDITIYSEGDFYATHSLRIKETGTEEEPKEIYASKEFKVSPWAYGDKMYIYTNHKAPNYKLMVTDLNTPEFKHWKELIPEGETVIESYTVLDDHILIVDKKDVLKRVLLYDIQGNFIKQISLPTVGDVSYVSYNRDVNTIFLGLTGFTKPFQIYKLDPSELMSENLSWELFWEQEIPVNTDNIEGKIVFYPSKDGTKVPLFIIHKKDIELNGDNPALLYGYGGFNVGMSPSFVGSRASFINRGGVYAIACLRGGDEYGESWHRDGMLKNKQNTFDDCIAAAEYLISENYTNKKRLGVMGGSNGGLLVGAVVTQRPDLFNVAVCAVPLLDMVRYHKFLIARYWIPEYGDPEVEADFDYIMSYSPYHNIRTGIDHPTIMVTAGENDTRVDPLHAKKFVAALQNNVGQKNPVLLKMNFDSGHGSGKSTKQQVDEQEFTWRFIMRSLGI